MTISLCCPCSSYDDRQHILKHIDWISPTKAMKEAPDTMVVGAMGKDTAAEDIEGWIEKGLRAPYLIMAIPHTGLPPLTERSTDVYNGRVTGLIH